MHAALYMNDLLCRPKFKRRADRRVRIALPILIAIGRTRYSALLHDLSSEGAMIETSAPLIVDDRIEVHCGSILTDGIVLWQAGSKSGIKFCGRVTEGQVDEQVSRSDAVANWRKGRIEQTVRLPSSN